MPRVNNSGTRVRVKKGTSKKEIKISKRRIRGISDKEYKRRFIEDDITARDDLKKHKNKYCKTCFNAGISIGKKEIIGMINPDKIYPKDIFPELSKSQLKNIHEMLIKDFGFPLDRLSAHIGRLILQGLNKKLMES